MNKTHAEHAPFDRSVTPASESLLYPDWQSPSQDPYFLVQSFAEQPFKPTIRTLVVDHATAAEMLPYLTKHIETLGKICDEHQVSKQHAAILVSTESVGLNRFHSPGPVLIAQVPEVLEGCLEQLLNQVPEVINVTSIDLQQSYTVREWGATESAGKHHVVSIPDAAIFSLLTEHDLLYRLDSLWYGRTIFIAGDRVGFSDYWLDSADMDEGQAAGICSQSYLHHTDAELLSATERANAAGSSTPWMHATWEDEDGIFRSELACAVERDNVYHGQDNTSSALEEDCPVMSIESSYDVYIATWDRSLMDYDGPWRHPVPAVRTRSISLDELGELIPTLPPFLSRLSELCDRDGLSREHAACLLSPDEIGKSPFQTTGPVLVARLPKQLEGCLEQLVNRPPEPRNIGSIDLLSTYTVADWGAFDKTGSPHVIYIQDKLYYDSQASEYIDGEEVFASWRLIFVAGDQVVLSELWEDIEVLSGCGALYVCSKARYSEEELLEAKKKADAAGSATPWMFDTWRDDDGTYHSALARYSMS
jgi:hypothetical protein